MGFIFNIKKANSEIERLTAENAAQSAQIKELTESTPESLASAEAALAESNSKAESLAAELATAQAVVGQLTKERDELAAKVTEAEKSADTLASKKAAEIVAAQGAQAAAVDPKDTGNAAEQLAQITDPVERAKFIRANRAKLFTPSVSKLKQ